MAKEEFMNNNISVSATSENFRALFFDVKTKTDELLHDYNNVDFLKNPSVDIKNLAKKNGIIDIKYVPKEAIPERHGTLKNGVISLNQDDPPEEQVFTTAHEMEHDIKQKAKEQKKRVTNKTRFSAADINTVLNKKDVKQVQSVLEEAARSNYEKVVTALNEHGFFSEIADIIAKNASKSFGKPIPSEKAFNSIAKLLCAGNKIIDHNFILKATDDLYNEEIADYFAANLLVPIERFMLWENKSNKDIAKAFKVSVGCIKKRREEIKLELEFMSS